jgi:iron(III) transport system ATP-binding protein
VTPLSITGLSKRFGPTHVVLQDVNLTVEAGELLVLLGPSGSGKTTLLRCIAGLIEPTTGVIRIGDRVVNDCDSAISVPTHKRGLGMVFQSFALWAHMTVRENVAYPLKSHRTLNAQRIAARVDEMLQLVHCAALADRLPTTLSGGQQQRVALARALAASPALLLFDEPLSNLDALLRLELRAQLRMIRRLAGFTGVYVTHDQAEALSLGDRVAVMNGGRIEHIGTPDEVYRNPATEFVAEFMGMSNRLPVSDGTAVARFRPEAVRLQRSGETQSAGAEPLLTIPEIEVVDRAFVGEWFEYSLSIEGQQFKARVAAKDVAPDVGDRIRVTILRDGAAFFPMADGACDGSR